MKSSRWVAPVVLVAVGCYLGWCLARFGHVAYPLDDTHIHLDLSRTLATSGTWGIRPGHFESASSSPLWTVLLAGALKILPGWAEWWPILLSTVSAAALLPAVDRFTRHTRLRVATGWPLTVLAATLAVIVCTGMEHALHAALVAWALVAYVGLVDAPRRRVLLSSSVLLALATLCRFETLGLAAGMAAGLLLRGRLREAVVLVAAAVLPTGGFALLNERAGQGPLPTSVLVKAGLQEASWRKLVDLPTVDPLLLLLLLAAAAVALREGRGSSTGAAALAVTVACVLHAGFADYGLRSLWTFRYEAYLVVATVMVVVRHEACGERSRWGVWRPLRTTVVLASAASVGVVCVLLPLSTASIDRQQAQTSDFLATLPPSTSIALNDLGLNAYRTRGPILDLYGLGSYEVSRMPKPLSADRLESLTQEHHVDVVVIYPTWFPTLPDSWTRVREWCVTGPESGLGGRCVEFYATRPDEAQTLESRLAAFEPRLPRGVVAL